MVTESPPATSWVVDTQPASRGHPFELLWISGLHDHVHRAIRADGGRRRSRAPVTALTVAHMRLTTVEVVKFFDFFQKVYNRAEDVRPATNYHQCHCRFRCCGGAACNIHAGWR